MFTAAEIRYSGKSMAASGLKTKRRGRPKQSVHDSLHGTRLNAYVRLLPIVVLSTFSWLLLRYFVEPQFDHDEYYIDEEFHVPQAQHYCRGEFHKWDTKITTFPGLYLLSTFVLLPFMKIYNIILSFIDILDNNYDYNPCSLLALRAINAIGAPACLFYSYNNCQQLLSQNTENKKTKSSEWSYIIRAMSVATFPVIYAPYSMLYYTDAWATASVFLWYSSHLNNKSNLWLKVILGGFCVLCRQTNIAWLVFASIIDVGQCAEQCFPAIKYSVSTFSYIQICLTELFDCCTIRKKNKTQKLINFIVKCWHATSSNIIVIVSFVLFVVIFNNGDIVIGDRNAHIPRFHPMQLCYFVIFALVFSFPWLLSHAYFNMKLTKSIKTCLNISVIFNEIPIVILIFLITVTTGLVYFNTIAHPYLLADNRHYTFYVWRLLFGPSKSVFLRYIPVPLYTYGLYFVDKSLTQSSIAYKLAYWIVTTIVLCAQFLLEPRYFVVPYIMFKLHSDKNNKSFTLKVATVEFVIYQICNCFIMWVFLYRPFVSTMDDTGRIDRFTW